MSGEAALTLTGKDAEFARTALLARDRIRNNGVGMMIEGTDPTIELITVYDMYKDCVGEARAISEDLKACRSALRSEMAKAQTEAMREYDLRLDKAAKVSSEQIMAQLAGTTGAAIDRSVDAKIKSRRMEDGVTAKRALIKYAVATLIIAAVALIMGLFGGLGLGSSRLTESERQAVRDADAAEFERLNAEADAWGASDAGRYWRIVDADEAKSGRVRTFADLAPGQMDIGLRFELL